MCIRDRIASACILSVTKNIHNTINRTESILKDIKALCFRIFSGNVLSKSIKGTKTTAIPNVTDKNAVKNQSPPV